MEGDQGSERGGLLIPLPARKCAWCHLAKVTLLIEGFSVEEGYRPADATMPGRSLRSSRVLSQREHFSRGWLLGARTAPGIVCVKQE